MQELAGVVVKLLWREALCVEMPLRVFPERPELVGDVLLGLLVVKIFIVEHRIRNPVFADFEALDGDVIKLPGMNGGLVFLERFEVYIPQRFRFLGCGRATCFGHLARASGVNKQAWRTIRQSSQKSVKGKLTPPVTLRGRCLRRLFRRMACISSGVKIYRFDVYCI